MASTRAGLTTLTSEQLQQLRAFHYAQRIMHTYTPAYVLGLLTASGGIIGYARTGSVPSIVAGVSVGGLYLLAGQRIQTSQPYGLELALLASVILAGSSMPRAIRSGKPVPIGLSAIALYGLVVFGDAWRRART